MSKNTKLPLRLITSGQQPLCHGYKWQIRNEDYLAKLVAKLLLGHYRHVQKILKNSNSISPHISSEMKTEVKRKLKDTSSDQLRYQRDGWVFQMISWIAIKISDPHLHTAIPHSQPAQKGFDNLVVQLTDDMKSIDFIYICEDKATENSRKTITTKVWPEFAKFETGSRDNELVNEVTPILERLHRNINIDIDKSISKIFWEKERHYRVSLTTENVNNDQDRKILFKGYDQKVKGNVKRRRAENINISGLREWMNNFCNKIIKQLGNIDV